MSMDLSSSSSTKANAKASRSSLKLFNLLRLILIALLAFYVGTLFGSRHCSSFFGSRDVSEKIRSSSGLLPSLQSKEDKVSPGKSIGQGSSKSSIVCDDANLLKKIADLESTLSRAEETHRLEKEGLIRELEEEKKKKQQQVREENCNSSLTEFFSQRKKKIPAVGGGISRVNKRSLLETHDYGWPLPADDKSEAIIIHEAGTSPNTKGDGSKIPFYSNVEDATKKCGELLVAALDHGSDTKKCLAVVNSYPSYHLARFMRHGGDLGSKNFDWAQPLRHSGRGRTSKGAMSFKPPDKNNIFKNWNNLQRYIGARESTHGELKPILERVARDNTVIVMVCNIGQAVLLVNFVCQARRSGFPLENLLVFSTDEKTHKLMTGLGVESYYDESNFSHLPEREAGAYGDRVFAEMMYAKVLSVQMVNFLGYDLLFQDVDMVWYKNPLELFHDKASKLAEYDMLFQDDGARSQRYAPYSSNSGFYFVRHNARTRYLFTSLMYHSDMIIQSGSHQQALIGLLTEHASLYGLRVKVLDDLEFPCGFHYHRRKDFMKNVAQGKTVPWVFHMSWTRNKSDKLKYFKQMGMWHVEEKCENEKGLDVIDKLSTDASSGSFFDECCSVDPILTCFYRDKPSKVPCKESPPIDRGRPSFW